jgi:hypothetical protein
MQKTPATDAHNNIVPAATICISPTTLGLILTVSSTYIDNFEGILININGPSTFPVEKLCISIKADIQVDVVPGLQFLFERELNEIAITHIDQNKHAILFNKRIEVMSLVVFLAINPLINYVKPMPHTIN